ncbi:MAG TPA: 1-acyl-sn-glycerol-3-phosphate acyltransferase [Gemmatimonadaceae bacterium]|nr:1-acyl-sn-glycerol-3-phosphate acyltransferase [Gemmatimonadaceae bacterium]
MPLDLHLPAQVRYTAPRCTAHDPFDADWARSIMTTTIDPLLRLWFRAEIVGAERIPPKGPVILAANHSGNAFPYDAIALDALLWSRDGMTDASKFRTVYEYELSLVWWMRPFGIDDFWRRGGGVDMTFDNFDALLRRGDRTLYFPEGVPGIGKGFGRRYQLQPFHTSFVRLAAEHDVPVLPLYVVNGEWIHPLGYTFGWLDWLMQRLFIVPFLPLPIGLLAVVFPWMWYLAFPAKLVFVVGEPVDVRAIVRDAPTMRAATDTVRALMQRGLNESVQRFGRTRYGIPQLWRALRRAPRGRWRAIPTGWPLSFIRHERDRERPPARNRLHAILRDLDLVAFYLPFGWPLLSLARMLRRAPYGHRGTTRAERSMREGRFVWRLAERPLPPVRPASG